MGNHGWGEPSSASAVPLGSHTGRCGSVSLASICSSLAWRPVHGEKLRKLGVKTLWDLYTPRGFEGESCFCAFSPKTLYV